MEISIGQIVISKAGHDKDTWYIVLKQEGEYVYVANGKLRLLDKPKKKKLKHLQMTNYIDNEIKERLEKVIKITNSDLRDVLVKYKNYAKGE